MPSLLEILRDPNYINANPATKQAIFERWAPQDQNYTGANDATKQAIRQRFGLIEVEPQPVPAEEPSGFLRQAADIPLSIGRGALTGVRMVADAFGAGSRASEAIKSAEGYVAGLMSAQARNDEQEIARIMKDAEDKGVLDQVQAAFKAFSVAPVDLLTQGLGTAGVGLLGMLGGKVLGAGTLGLRAIGVASGAGMGAGAAKGGIYEEVKAALLDAKIDEARAEKAALEAQAYGGKNLDQILLSAGLGAVTGGVGIEGVASRILSRAAAKEAAGQAAKGAIREAGEGALKTAAAEGLPEYLQGSQEQLAKNIALQREGFDVDTMRGVVGSGVLEGLAGAGLGAIAGGTEAGLRRQARAEAERVLAEEEKQRIALEEQAEQQRIEAERIAEEERMRPVREALARVPAEEPVGPSITSTDRAALLGGAEPMTSTDPLAAAISARRQEREAAAEVPLGEDYAFLQREKQRLLAAEQTPETKAELGRIEQQIQSVLQRDLSDIEKSKTSVFAQEQLPPVESRGAVVAERDLAEMQAREGAPEMTDFEQSRAAAAARMTGKPFVDEAALEEQKTKEKELRSLKAERNKIKAGGNLYKMLEEKLDPSEVKDIATDIKKVYGKGYKPLESPTGQGTFISELVENGILDNYLPMEMRPSAANFDVQRSTEYIKDKIRNKETKFEASQQEIQKLDNRIAELSDEIGRPTKTAAEIAEANLAEREARAETIGAEAVPEVEALRRQAREQGIDTSVIEEQAFEEARENPDLNPDTILAERLSDALGVERRYQKEELAQGATDSGINIDPEDQRIEKELTGKSMIQVADWAIQNAPNAFARVIAEKVKARLLAFQRKGMTLEFKIQGGQNRTLNMRRARGVTSFDWGKDDKGTTITVTLNGAAVLNNQNGYPPGTRYSTVLHELLHVATRAQFVFMPNTDPLKQQMIELFNAVADRYNADARAGKLPPVMEKYYKRINNVLEDPDEMLAWGLTDRDVQEYFDDIKVGEKSIWSQLVELIRKALGLGKPYESALERLVRTSDSLLEVDVNSIDDMLSLRGKQIGGKKKPAGPMVQESLFQREGRVPQTETEAFKRWFGDSKVVDAEGKPLVMYHGTVRDFTAFDPKAKPLSGGYKQNAIFLSPNPKFASEYSEGDGGQVMPVYVKAGNPFDFENEGDLQELARELVATDYKNADDATYQAAMDGTLSGLTSAAKQRDNWELFEREDVQKAIRDMGFDGFYIREAGVKNLGVFKPDQIKSATGNIGAYGQRPITKEEAARFGMTEQEAEQAQVRGDIRYQREAEPEEPRKAKPTRLNIAGEPVLGSWNIQVDPKLEIQDGLIYKLLDKNIDVKRIVQSIEKVSGEIAQRWNPYLQEELYHGRTANATQDFADDEWQPLLKEMDRLDVTVGELEQYLHNRHAEDYNKLVAKRNPNKPEMQDGGSNIRTEDAREYLKKIPDEKRKKFEALAKRVDAITKGTRRLLLENGYETPERIEAWEKAFPNYVPLMREEGDFDYNFGSFGTGRGFDVRRDFSRSAMGSKRQVVDILGNIIAARNNAIMLTEKNRVAQAVYGLAVQNPNPDFWMAINPEAEKVPEDAIDELRALGISEDAVKFLMKEPRQRRLDPKKNEILSSINQTLRQNDYVLATRINGERRYVFFNPKDERSKRAVTALKNLDAENLGMVLGTVAKITRWMASVNTQYNPIFGIYNFLRDTQAAALQLSTTPLAGKQLEIGKEIPSSLRAIYGSLRKRRGGEKVDTEMAQLWKEFQKEGGQTGFKDVFSRTQDRQEALVKEMMRIKEGKVKQAGRAVFDWLSDYNDTLENAVRLAAYKVAKKKFIGEGRSETDAKQLAASLAKNLTVNFNRKGDAALQAGALYAFFNASMQGTARAYETLKGPTGKKILAGGFLWGVMQAAIYAFAGFDEDEPPEFVRERNIVIPTGDGKYLAFPMPLGYHVIPGITRILSEWALSGFKDTPDRIASLTGMFLEAFNPIGNAGWSVQTIAPTFADPIVALGENKDWTGKPISKEDLFSLDPTPGYTRARDGANFLAEGIAKFLNFATGGTRADPGVISPTPEQIEYLIGQATGGLGREITKGLTSVEKTITGEELPPYKIPLYGRFVGETKSSAAESNRFYKNMEKLNILDREIKVRRENREPIAEFMRENPEARLAPMARKTYKDIQQLRKRREQLVERDAPRESVKAVEEQIRRRMAMFNERVAQLKD